MKLFKGRGGGGIIQINPQGIMGKVIAPPPLIYTPLVSTNKVFFFFTNPVAII